MRLIYIILLVSTIIYTGILPALADETEWVDPQEKTLRLTETFQRAGFLVEATDFYNNTDLMALITVYDTNRMLITRNITRINESIVIDDIFNITVIDLQDRTGNLNAGHGVNATVDQWVRIRTRVPGSPSPKISIVPYEKQINNKTVITRIFTPGSEMSINFSIKNEGKAILKTLYLKINSSLPLFQGEKLNYELPDLKAGNVSETVRVRFVAPFTEERKPFTISAEAYGTDVFGKIYRAADFTYIEVKPEDKGIMFRKYTSEKIFMGDIAVVSFSIKNNDSKRIDNLSLIESLPAGIELVDNVSWNFSLEPDEQKLISYKIKPEKPGTYLFPPGSSRIEYGGGYIYNTNLNKLIVSGPYVVLMKSADNINPVRGETVNVTIEARNIGDVTAIVKISDAFPEDYRLSNVSQGKYKLLSTAVLHPGSSTLFSYSLKANEEGSYNLTPANAIVSDQFLYQDERYIQKIASNELIIRVGRQLEVGMPPSNITPVLIRTVAPESVQTPAAAETSKKGPGFEGYAFILFLLVLWGIIKPKSRR